MNKRLMLLLAAVLLALPLGGTVATAAPGGNSNDVSGDTGNACPDSAPDEDGDGDPACGRQGNKGNNGKNGKECPPNSGNPGGTPPNCGHPVECDEGEEEFDGECVPECEADETRNAETGECELECDEGEEEFDGECVPECEEGETRNTETGECETTPPPPGEPCADDLGELVIEVPADPVAYACIVLGPAADNNDPQCPAGGLETGVVSADPVVELCATLGPGF